jgi:hypothetical protein
VRALFTSIVLPLFLLCGDALAQDTPPLDLHSIPISDWLNAGEHSQIGWKFTVGRPFLRPDQHLEVAYNARISGKDLNRAGAGHELFLVNRISTPDGEWLNEPYVVRHTLEGKLPSNLQAEFLIRFVAQPGEYVVWAVLYDRKTGKHNVASRRIRVPEIRGDPLPDLYQRMPLVEFLKRSDSDNNGIDFVEIPLYLPVQNSRPVRVELISMLSPPEQWTGRRRIMRTHNDATVGALTALSQLELAQGSISLTGLDLVRRQVMFEERELPDMQWEQFLDAMRRAQSLDISADALQGSKNNGAFFREFLNQRLTGDSISSDGMRVIIVVTSSRLFENGSDLRPVQIEGACNCRLYYLRFRLNPIDVFDQLEKLMKPLRPRIFNVITSRDLRKAIAEIVADLKRL